MVKVRIRLESGGRMSATVADDRTGKLEKVLPEADRKVFIAALGSKVEMVMASPSGPESS